MYKPPGVNEAIEDLYDYRTIDDLHEEHKTDPVIRLDVNPNTLVITCLKLLAKTFSKDAEIAPAILKCIPHFNMDIFLKIIPTDAPLEITVPNINSDVYWKRRCMAKWPDKVYAYDEKNYKQLFAEAYLGEFLEQINPGYEDYEEIRELCILLHKEVLKLHIRKLKAAKKRSGMDQVDCHDIDEIAKRLDLRYVTTFLPKLVELHLSLGMENPNQVSAIRQAVLLEEEVENIGEAIMLSKLLTIFKISNSCFRANDLAILYHYIIETNIIVIRFDCCFLCNAGAQVAALLIKNHIPLVKLSLKDNDIREEGGYALAYALAREIKSQLRVLDLSLNPIGDEAGVCLATIIANHPTLEEINMQGTRLSINSGDLFAKAIELNHRILNLNLSCNEFNRDNAIAFIQAVENNHNIEYLDLRSCNFEHVTLYDIRDILFENREAKRVKMISKPPKRQDKVKILKEYLENLDEKEKIEPLIYDPVPHFGSHRTSSITLSDHGQLTLSTVDSTSSASTVSEKEPCPDKVNPPNS